MKVDGLREHLPSIWEYPGMTIMSEASLFLSGLAESGRSASPHTWKAAATDVEGWLNYLLARGIVWGAAIVDDLISYRDALLTVPSQKTGEPCSSATVRRRMVYILEFYRYLAAKGLYVGDIVDGLSEVKSYKPFVPSDLDAMTHTRPKTLAKAAVSSRSKLLPKGCHVRHPRPLSVKDYRALAAAAGPRPSEREDGSGRDRLILDLTTTGSLRINEIERLRVDQVAALDPQTTGRIIIRGIEGKGRGGKKIRDIEINSEVAKDILAYIEGERRQAVNQFKKKYNTLRAPTALFYSRPDYGRPGPLSADGIRAAFNKLQIEAKLVDIDRHGNPRHRYAFHDLRHTYASWTAAISVEKGIPTNWRAIADQMGHSDPSLTKKIYTHFVEILEPGTRTFIDLSALTSTDGVSP
ncbi:Site-specific recombinase XerD [Kordiimonas lacus]|uniref:Site-specific recombinase XerD n=2 Tax=Kordiimonas lacus TaxID=637679 RepID=A0A1G7E164_9PROT|nr:Site-specific recombinase XerD [Kordiimonas lacus]